MIRSPTLSLRQKLYNSGARNFLFLTVSPTNQAPSVISNGDSVVAAIKSSLTDYDAQLASSAAAFQQKHAKNIGLVTVFDTHPTFNTYLDHAETFGFVNFTG
jgi:phospholipase/lecithinase/hemolysin